MQEELVKKKIKDGRGRPRKAKKDRLVPVLSALKPETAQVIRRLAKQEGRSRSDIMREAVERYVRESVAA